ncbi:MAG: class IV adenylate cyclase [Ectothiorhodospiraceae bacterium]|nr:class IV adenylate cyclase [Ectothiorhodospiraceae bacterium]
MTYACSIELKAKAENIHAQRRMAAELANGAPVCLRQTDTYFNASAGALKLRKCGDGNAELLHYRRSDSLGPKQVVCIRAPVNDPVWMKTALGSALGIRGVVGGARRVFRTDAYRISLDTVDGLGDFIRIDVPLRNGMGPLEGVTIADGLMRALAIRENQWTRGSYLDLLVPATANTG